MADRMWFRDKKRKVQLRSKSSSNITIARASNSHIDKHGDTITGVIHSKDTCTKVIVSDNRRTIGYCFRPYGSQSDCDYMDIGMEGRSKGLTPRQFGPPALCHKMRLKDFIYSTLPRNNKKSLRSKSTGADHVTHSKNSSNTASNDLNRDCNDSFPIKYNKSLVTEDFQYKETDFDNHNRCNSLSEYTFVPISPNDTSNEDYFSNFISGKSIVQCPVDFGDVNFNTVPKCRTRIKTNPWLPSPKTSPTPSGFTSPMTSSIGSTGAPEFAPGYDLSRDSSFEESQSNTSSFTTESGFSSTNVTTTEEGTNSEEGSYFINYNNISPLTAAQERNKNGVVSCCPRRESIDSGATEFDSVMQTSFISDVYDYYSTEEVWHDNCRSNKSDYSVLEEVVNDNRDYDDSDNICFNYEADFEEQIESSCIDGDIVSSRDDIFDVFNSMDKHNDLDMMDTQYNSPDKIVDYRYSTNNNEEENNDFIGGADDEVFLDKNDAEMGDDIIHSSDVGTQACSFNDEHLEDSDETVQPYYNRRHSSSGESDIVYDAMEQEAGLDDVFEDNGGQNEVGKSHQIRWDSLGYNDYEHINVNCGKNGDNGHNIGENGYNFCEKEQNIGDYKQNKGDNGLNSRENVENIGEIGLNICDGGENECENMYKDNEDICCGYSGSKSPLDVTDIPFIDETESDIKSSPLNKTNHSKAPSKVGAVKNSLRDKVRKLKQDKEVVDEIVRKAKQEEHLRRMELIRIQKQTTLARKEILLTTLTELRAKLEAQTDRLQSAYERVITLQFNNTGLNK